MWYRKAQAVFNENSETNQEWLDRHNVEEKVINTFFITLQELQLTELRAGSLLAETPQEAATFGDTNVWNDRRKSLVIYKVLVSPDEIITGYWASLVNDHPVEVYYKISRKSKENL